jgi:hypothetical protein
MANPRIQLTVYLPNNTQPSAGELLLGDLMPQNKSVIFHGTFSTLPYSLPLERFVELHVRLTSNVEPDRTWGSVVASAQEVVQLAPTRNSILTFTWHLTPADLEDIERERAGARYVTFNVMLEGLALVTREAGSELHPIRGQSQLQLSVTEWEDKVLNPLSYALPPSWERLMPDRERREHPEWGDAERRLDESRKFLRRGEPRDALGAALDAFESILSAPYDAKEWRAKLQTTPEDIIPPQKREAIADMFAGFCTYLNRVGHHRSRKADAVSAMLPAMPVDQWEAEHVIAVAHFLLPLALRMEAARQAAASAPPTTASGP